MSIIKNISRRSFLISSTAFLALPTLESVAANSQAASKRLLCVGLGFGFTGFTDGGFFPTEVGSFAKHGIKSSMEPLRPYMNEITMVDKLVNVGYHGAHDGSSQFMRAGGSVSCDILAGSYLSKEARYQNIIINSTEFGDGHGKYGLSFNFRGDPMPGSRSNLDLYKQLFGGGESREKILQRIRQKRSVLDSLRIDHRNFTKQVTKADKEKLDEYFQAIREIELELKRETAWIDIPKPKAPFAYRETNLGGKSDSASKKDGIKDVKLSYDLITAAFQSGQTNVASMTIPNIALLTSLGIKDHIHSISHYNSSKELTKKSKQRDKANMELFAYGIKKLKETKDVNGLNLFDNTAFICGTNIRSGHGLRDMPFLLTGGAIKRLKKGHFVRPEHKKVPLGNALLTILNELGIDAKSFGNSTGKETSFIA